DKDYFEHGGVSFTGLMRGIYQTYVRHARTVGGSTLSQQTAKAIMASVEGEESVRIRSGWPGVRRKAREFILTRRLENNFDKEHILWLYLNEVYFGHHSYGVQAAAENYFRKNVWELSLPEISLVAGLPQAPSKYSPFAHPERSKARRMYVLRRMFEEGMGRLQQEGAGVPRRRRQARRSHRGARHLGGERVRQGPHRRRGGRDSAGAGGLGAQAESGVEFRVHEDHYAAPGALLRRRGVGARHGDERRVGAGAGPQAAGRLDQHRPEQRVRGGDDRGLRLREERDQ